jgi:hypothetical protein
MLWLREPPFFGSARVLLVSQRAARRQPSRALRFEFEDVVRALEASNLIASDRRDLPPALARRASALLERVAPGSSWLLDRDRPDDVAGKYELVLVAVESLFDLQLLRPLSWLLQQARMSVCLLEEVWTKGLAHRAGELQLLRQFDHVLLTTSGSVDLVAELTGRPCSYFPPSVDALALCPYPHDVPRSIDVYSMGRRSPVTHAALLDLAERRRWFYLRDTLTGCNMQDHREHRRLLGDLLKRTRYFLTYPGKVDAAAETGGQQEIGFRYFEGTAAGAVLLGEAPDNPWFEKLFGWTDAVVRLPYGSGDPAAALSEVDADPARQVRIRKRNVVESLLRHDHVYRWAEVLRHAGLPETPPMAARRSALRDLAGSLTSEVPARASEGGGADVS